MTTSLLQGKPFYCREWAFGKIARCLTPPVRIADPPGAPPVPPSDGFDPSRPPGTIIMGGPGCGKTALCCEILWPTASHGKAKSLGDRVIAYYFCQVNIYFSILN